MVLNNKRGQEGVTLTTLLLIVLGVIVVVVIILGATGVLNDVFGTRTALPGNVEAIAQICKISIQGGFIADYCYNFKKVSNTEYINCQDARVVSSLTQQGFDLTSFTCLGKEADGKKLLTDSARERVCAGITGVSDRASVSVGGTACPTKETTTP